jgi:ABC-type cobalamin transport system ATPase subunit
MQRWEYMTLTSSKNYGTVKYYINDAQQQVLKNQKLVDVINQIGGQGWEMVGLAAGESENIYIFKRPTDTAPPPLKPRPTTGRLS